MNRVYNFSAGPAILPLDVLEQAQRELLCHGGSGMSVMEMSHRSKVYKPIIQKAEADLRTLMGIPENYKVLFLQGGASLQFSMVPMNLMHKTKKAYYAVTGSFAKKAYKEAKLFGEAVCAINGEASGFTVIPDMTADMFPGDGDYVHITSNNTIYGTRMPAMPDLSGMPLVSDMSSCILSEEINVSDYGLIYAGAQKNIGPAGVTIVIIREDLIGLNSGLPSMLDYAIHAKDGSMYNTPPTFSIYMAGLVFEKLLREGGLKVMQEINEKKAAILYDYLDNESSLFKAVADKSCRSMMNVTFVTGDADMDKRFVAEAEAEGLVNLAGHRSVGGMRASIYNAMPTEGVRTLVDFMREFEKKA